MAKSGGGQQYDEAVAALYEAVLAPAGLKLALASVRHLMQATGVAQWKVLKTASGIDCLHSHGHDSATLGDYASYFHRIDPAAARGLIGPAGNWVMDAQALDPNNASHREYVYDFCVPHEIGGVAEVKILETADAMFAFGMTRPPGAAPFEQDREILEQLLPHLVRSARLTEFVQARVKGEALLEATLDKLPAAVCIAAPDGRLEYLNAAAANLLTGRGDLSIRGGKLRGTNQSTDSQLARALVGACVAPRVASGFRLGPDGAQVVVAPLGEGAEVAGTAAPIRALVLIEDDTRPHPEDVLGGLFGLTAAEARLARAIGRGDSLETVHQRDGQAMSTLRTHLARIFQKAGVTSQGQLVALIRTLPAIGDRE